MYITLDKSRWDNLRGRHLNCITNLLGEIKGKPGVPDFICDYVMDNLEDIIVGDLDKLLRVNEIYESLIDAAAVDVGKFFVLEFKSLISSLVSPDGSRSVFKVKKEDEREKIIKEALSDGISKRNKSSNSQPLCLEASPVAKIMGGEKNADIVLAAIGDRVACCYAKRDKIKSGISCEKVLDNILPDIVRDVLKIVVDDILKLWFSYKKLEAEYLYELCDAFDVKVCPYCNLSYTHMGDYDNKVMYRPEIDHYLPQSRYPILALSLYNYIPACKLCNFIKNQEDFGLAGHFYPLGGGDDDAVFFIGRDDKNSYRSYLRGRNLTLKIRLPKGHEKTAEVLHLVHRYSHVQKEAEEIFRGMQKFRISGFRNKFPWLKMVAMRGVNKNNYRSRILGKLIMDFERALLKSTS